MNKIKLTLLVAGLLASAPVLGQTAGGTENTGPQGSGNFVVGTAPSQSTGPEGTGNYVAGQTSRSGTPVAGQPEDGSRARAQQTPAPTR